MLMRNVALATGAVLLSAAPLAADVVETRDGARLVGQIVKIEEGVLYLETSYAGTLEISKEQVVSFSRDDSEVARAPAAEEKPERRWHYEVGLDLAGKEGNSREFGLGGNFVAALKSPDDTLMLLAEYERQQTDGEKTTNRMRGAIDYEAFFHKYFGWYVRTALEKDDIERIDLRSTTGAGISYRLLNLDHHRLVLRSGLGYRYTSYKNDKSNDSDPTMDLGLIHRYDFGSRLSWRNELTYSPNISEFEDYRVFHDSALEMPVGTGDYWKLRMGVRNDYDSQPVVDKRLDTSYYTRLILSWQ